MAIQFETEDFILEGHALIRARNRSRLADDELDEMLEKLRTGKYHVLGFQHGGIVSCEVQIKGKRIKVVFVEPIFQKPKLITVIPI